MTTYLLNPLKILLPFFLLQVALSNVHALPGLSQARRDKNALAHPTGTAISLNLLGALVLVVAVHLFVAPWLSCLVYILTVWAIQYSVWHTSNPTSHPRPLLGTLSPWLFAILLLLAWVNRFIQDDAFISFRYAWNFVQGHGLTWNPGETPVEGYTNFLWTLLIASGLYGGVEPVLFSQIAGLVCYAWTLLLTYRLTLLFLGTSGQAVAVLLLLGTNFSFSAYATGGLETSFQTALLLSVVWGYVEGREKAELSSRRLMLISFLSALALLTRLDSALVLLVIYGAWGRTLLPIVSLKETLRRLAAAVLPATGILLPYFCWKLAYYGNILPNTYYAKITEATSLLSGATYVFSFFANYGWLFPLILALASLGEIWKTGKRTPILLLLTGLWVGYVVRVGGDFMEFRMLVPVLPYVAILFVLVLSLYFRPRIQIAVLAGLILMSLYYQMNGISPLPKETNNIGRLHGYLTRAHWDRIGMRLGEYFGELSPPVRLAVTAAGAIPFYSQLPTLDMYGLNDPWVAHHGTLRSAIPGHQRQATLAYVLESGANLVLGHPTVYSREAAPTRYTLAQARFEISPSSEGHLPEEACVLEIPIDSGRVLHTLYLTRHTEIDRLIRENVLSVIEIDRPTVPR